MVTVDSLGLILPKIKMIATLSIMVCFFQMLNWVFPCVSLDNIAQGVNLKLTHLPLLPLEEVLNGLQISLKPFGDIMDVGICTESATVFFHRN